MTTTNKPVFQIGDFSVVTHGAAYAILDGKMLYETELSLEEAKLVAMHLRLMSIVFDLNVTKTKQALKFVQGF
jgi:hypothetical protein